MSQPTFNPFSPLFEQISRAEQLVLVPIARNERGCLGEGCVEVLCPFDADHAAGAQPTLDDGESDRNREAVQKPPRRGHPAPGARDLPVDSCYGDRRRPSCQVHHWPACQTPRRWPPRLFSCRLSRARSFRRKALGRKRYLRRIASAFRALTAPAPLR